MKHSLKFLAYLLAGLLLNANVWATPVTSMYVFGDSLSDAGNNPSAILSIYNLGGGHCDPIHPCPPYVDGHYSNGPTAAEYLANSILPGGANPANFHSFAVSGATSGVGNYGDGGTATTAGGFGLPGIGAEIDYYLSLSGGVSDPGALYFIWGGANDFLTLDSPTASAHHIASYVEALASGGATHLLVPNLPDLGLTPYVVGAGLMSEGHGFSVAFNAQLAAELGGISSLFPTADIIQFDTFSLINDVVANPGNYGFTNATNGCILTPSCIPNEFIFWDGFHPTTRAHKVIETAFASAVPEPGSIFLFLIGLFALGTLTSQRRRLNQGTDCLTIGQRKTCRILVRSSSWRD